MTDVKEFQRTMKSAEQQIKDHLSFLNNKEADSQIFSSCGAMENSINKIVELMDPQKMPNFKQHIDNVYYHIGKIKGCL